MAHSSVDLRPGTKRGGKILIPNQAVLESRGKTLCHSKSGDVAEHVHISEARASKGWAGHGRGTSIVFVHGHIATTPHTGYVTDPWHFYWKKHVPDSPLHQL